MVVPSLLVHDSTFSLKFEKLICESTIRIRDGHDSKVKSVFFSSSKVALGNTHVPEMPPQALKRCSL